MMPLFADFAVGSWNLLSRKMTVKGVHIARSGLERKRLFADIVDMIWG
jgi:hypothetical protein